MIKTLKNKIIIFGYGYVAEAIIEELDNADIISTSRSGKLSDLAKIIPFSKEYVMRELENTTHIISTIPPDSVIGDPVINNFRDIIIKSENLKYIAYISSTSIYGDHNGNWVNEESSLNLESSRSKERYKAEIEWQKIGKLLNIPTIIFRISGIYGPKRNVFERIKNGNLVNIFKENHYFNRIHIDDIVSSIKASLSLDKKNNIYNLADNVPSPQTEVIEYAYSLLGKIPPEKIDFQKANLTNAAKEFYNQNKKVSNLKIKSDLGIILKYPSFKEGLESILKYMD